MYGGKMWGLMGEMYPHGENVVVITCRISSRAEQSGVVAIDYLAQRWFAVVLICDYGYYYPDSKCNVHQVFDVFILDDKRYTMEINALSDGQLFADDLLRRRVAGVLS